MPYADCSMTRFPNATSTKHSIQHTIAVYQVVQMLFMYYPQVKLL